MSKGNRKTWYRHIERLIQIQSYKAFGTDVTICALCYKPMKVIKGRIRGNIKDWNVDHIVPVSLGGSKYSIDNKQLTHKSCNSDKGNDRSNRANVRVNET